MMKLSMPLRAVRVTVPTSVPMAARVRCFAVCFARTVVGDSPQSDVGGGVSAGVAAVEADVRGKAVLSGSPWPEQLEASSAQTTIAGT
jgi:hypothetical protein